MAKGVTVSYKERGRFKTAAELKREVEKMYGVTLRRAGAIIKTGLRGVTPVKTGYLRQSTDASEPYWESSVYKVEIGPDAPYAKWVNARGKHRGYIRRGLKASAAKAKAELRQGAARLKLGNLWISE